MATNKELEAQIRELHRVLEARGIILPKPPARSPKERADYIEFGSPAHAAMLGLVEVAESEKSDFITYASRDKTWRLEDEVTAFMHYSDPKQVAALVLRQKVNVLETGAPQVPDSAPPMWTPDAASGQWQSTVIPA